MALTQLEPNLMARISLELQLEQCKEKGWVKRSYTEHEGVKYQITDQGLRELKDKDRQLLIALVLLVAAAIGAYFYFT